MRRPSSFSMGRMTFDDSKCKRARKECEEGLVAGYLIS